MMSDKYRTILESIAAMLGINLNQSTIIFVKNHIKRVTFPVCNGLPPPMEESEPGIADTPFGKFDVDINCLLRTPYGEVRFGYHRPGLDSNYDRPIIVIQRQANEQPGS